VERLTERCQTARRALALLEELAARPQLSPLERDAAIQRFEYSFESVWKAVQLYLREVEGLVVGSPKRAARASLESQLLNEDETRRALAMIDDRNQTVRTYNEELAKALAARLPQHACLLRSWLDRMIGRAFPGDTILAP
jgi:nucleotidyltransferase substrate binding protein (TIGR01987 family)